MISFKFIMIEEAMMLKPLIKIIIIMHTVVAIPAGRELMQGKIKEVYHAACESVQKLLQSGQLLQQFLSIQLPCPAVVLPCTFHHNTK